jgi:hypothetical protein
MKNLFQTGLMVLAFAGMHTASAQVPLLSSYPSATAVIFLDFDGHTVTGTSWNYNGPIVCGASGLNNTQITEVFNRVAEDYRPFNVNVTTDSTKFLAAPLNRRMRVIITVTSDWYGSAGGVAFLNSFTWSDHTPCFVFSALLNYNTKNIAEAVSHEAGHTLGLYHQARYDENCVKISDYHTGNGTGEIGWAPIMGVGYYRNFTLWNNGPNPYGCNNLQNDLSVITTNNGFGYRPDDHANTFAQATNLSFSANQFQASGVISQTTDFDMFKFTMPSLGRFILNAVPYNVGTGNSGSNLDMQISLYNNSQTLLNVYNPGLLLNSVIDTNLTAGVYYLRVEGKGNMYASEYASLGSYSLEGNFSNGGTLPLHRLELRGNMNGDRHQLSWIIEADEQVVSQVIEKSTDGTHFSTLVQPGNDDRNYAYKPLESKSVQYRLNVTFDDGRQYFSNIITIRATGAVNKPFIMGNVITGNTIKVSSPPGIFSFDLFDMNGKTVMKGRLANGVNDINVPFGFRSGMYILRFSDGENQWMEKLIKH